MTDGKPPFYLWHDLLNDGGMVAVSTYEKYNGGLSPRDVLALTRVLATLSSHNPRHPIEARSFLSFQPEDWDTHLILVGGLLSNQVTRALTQSPLRRIKESFVLRREMLRDTCRPPGKDCLTPSYTPGLETNVAGTKVDYGLITFQPNPMNLNRRLYILGGIKGWGVLAAATVFSSWESYHPLNLLFEEHFGMSAEAASECPLVEIVVRTEIGSEGMQGARNLKNLSVELVRVNGDPHAQWERPGAQLGWVAKPRVADRRKSEPFPARLSLSLSERVAVTELRGAAFSVRFAGSSLTGRELDQFEYDIASAVERPDWRTGAKLIAERLKNRLPNGFAELLHRMPTLAVRAEKSSVRFVTPREYLRGPFEFLRTERDYLVLEYAVFRAISDAFSVRSRLSPEFVEQLKLDSLPLRVLLVASDPVGDIMDDVNEEIETLLQVYQKMEAALRVEINATPMWAEDVTIRRLWRTLQDCPYHILHYAGHSAWDPDNPERSGLSVPNSAGVKETLSATKLASCVRNSELRFCFLSSCEGTRSAAERLLLRYDFLGLADALVQAGVPEVMGFRWPVSSRGAMLFAQSFYRALLGAAEMDTASAALLARRGVADADRDDLTWLSPILIAQR